MYSIVGELEEKSTDDNNYSNQMIGIAAALVLFIAAVICIVGLLIWIVKLKIAQAKSKQT